MNWYKKAKQMTVYRGEYHGNKGGHYYSLNKEFARQFTQSGQDHEIRKRTIDTNLIYDARNEGIPLPQATDEKEFDDAMSKTLELGLIGFRLTEGVNQPDSIYILSTTPTLKM